MAKVIDEQIKKRIRDTPVLDVGFVKTINPNNSEIITTYTVDVYLPDRELTLESTPVLSNMFGNDYGEYFIPTIDNVEVGQKCIVVFLNKQLEDAVVLGFLRTEYPTKDTIPTLKPNEKLIRHKSSTGAFSEIKFSQDNQIDIRQLNSSNVEQSYIKLKANGDIEIVGGNVKINNGTMGAARIGDAVSVSVPSHGTCTGTITGGSSTVKVG